MIHTNRENIKNLNTKEKNFKSPIKLRQKGFTLIEILIVMAIMGTISLLILTTISQLVDFKSTSDLRAQRYRQAQQALERISRDLSMAYLAVTPTQLTQFPRTFFIGHPADGVDSLQFSYFGHWPNHPNAKESDTAIVSYFGMPSKADTFKLVRKETRQIQPQNLDNLPQEEEIICDNIVLLEFAYYHSSRFEWLSQWETTGVGAFNNQLPVFVKMRIIFVDDLNQEIALESKVRIWMTQPVDNVLR